MTDPTDARDRILALWSELKPRAQAFEEAHGEQIDDYRELVSDTVQAAIRRLQSDLSKISGDSELCREIGVMAGDYVEWLQWTFWDLPYFAVAVKPDRERFARRLEACALVYSAGRLIDDFADRHFLYRGRRRSMLAASAQEVGGFRSEVLTVVTAVLMCFEGLGALLAAAADDTPDDPWATAALEEVVDAARRVLIGVLLEQEGPEAWNEDYYERLIQLKNVDYWRILGACLGTGGSELMSFLRDHFALAQRLNDVQDHGRDEAAGQPNLVSIYRREGEDPLVTAEGILAEGLLALAERAAGLPPLERQVAEVKWVESVDEVRRLGFFAAPPRVEPEDSPPPRAELGLLWASRLDEFVERGGADVLEEAACGVCGAEGGRPMFRRQGFLIVRCPECGHAYVSPRLKPAVQAQLGTELDGLSDDPFLETQKLGAEYLCGLLRREASGPRLLDIGFGRGYLLRMARAFSFEVYGIETSADAFDRLWPMFGDRLHRLHVDEQDLPWGCFDVVVMSHVLEHLPNPAETLRRLRPKLNPGGLLYVAVPDLESLQFKILGKRWDAMNPVAHYQFFHQDSLARLLEEAGFEVGRRVPQPALTGALVRPWMKLFRELGGDESGELALLAHRPHEDDDRSSA